METIEERAGNAWLDYEYRDGCLYNTTFEDGYVIGATEQKDIDVDKVCEWLEDNCKGYFMCDKVQVYNLTDALRKSMEG